VAAGDPGPGGTIATGGGEAASPDDPTVTSVTTPSGGVVTIDETGEATEPAPSGYTLIGQVAMISAPDGTVAAPIRIRMRVDASVVPDGVDASNVEIFRNGVVVQDCLIPSEGRAEPDPCVVDASTVDGDLVVTVLTTRASEWALGFHKLGQTITFPKVPVQRIGDPPVRLLATAGSGLPVTYRVASGPCTVAGDELTTTAVGECLVVASQPGDDVWAPAPEKQRTVTITLAP
jgi:hypothetical protein